MTDMDSKPVFEDFAEVALARPFEVQGVVMPAGARGVVMAAYEDGLAYEVEFEAPVQVVLTLRQEDIRAAGGV